MNREEAYEWLAPKLSLSERKVLDVIYNSPMDQSRVLSDGWRDVRKETPEADKDILIYDKMYDVVIVGRYNGGKSRLEIYSQDMFERMDWVYLEGALFWMPLPDPPAFA